MKQDQLIDFPQIKLENIDIEVAPQKKIQVNNDSGTPRTKIYIPQPQLGHLIVGINGSSQPIIPLRSIAFNVSNREQVIQGFKPYKKKQEDEVESALLSNKQITVVPQRFFLVPEQQWMQQFLNQQNGKPNDQSKASISDRHKEKNYNKNFIKSIGAKIIAYIKDNLNSYLKTYGIQEYEIQNHIDHLDREKKVSVQFFKSLMHMSTDDCEELKILKRINRALGYRYLKQYAQKDIFRNNKVIKENQGAYLLHCKLLERKISNPEELDYLC